MRIDSMKHNSAVNAYMANASKSKSGSKSAQAMENDSVELSKAAQEYAQLVKTTREAIDTAEFDEAARVQQLKDAIAKGEYEVPNEELIQSLITFAG